MSRTPCSHTPWLCNQHLCTRKCHSSIVRWCCILSTRFPLRNCRHPHTYRYCTMSCPSGILSPPHTPRACRQWPPTRSCPRTRSLSSRGTPDTPCSHTPWWCSRRWCSHKHRSGIGSQRCSRCRRFQADKCHFRRIQSCCMSCRPDNLSHLRRPPTRCPCPLKRSSRCTILPNSTGKSRRQCLHTPSSSRMRRCSHKHHSGIDLTLCSLCRRFHPCRCRSRCMPRSYTSCQAGNQLSLCNPPTGLLCWRSRSCIQTRCYSTGTPRRGRFHRPLSCSLRRRSRKHH
jgi:hypothetical protein